MASFVDVVCEREFGALPERSQHLSTGNVKETAVVSLREGRTVVVQWSDADLSTEALVVRELANRTAVPVPAVLADGDVDGRSYVVSEFVPGSNLHVGLATAEPDVRERVLRKLGEYLASVHEAFRFDGFGPVFAVDGTLDVERRRPWREYLGELLEDGLAELPPALSDLRDPIESAYDPSVLPANPPARLYPWDYRPGNALVRNGAVVALLDWGDPRTAHRELSFAKSEYCTVDWYGQADHREAFREGYESVSPLEAGYRRRRRQYRLVAIVRSAVTAGGSVTRPGYPMADSEDAVAFHRRAVAELL